MSIHRFVRVEKLKENDGILVDDVKYRVIVVTASKFDMRTVVLVVANYEEGLRRLYFSTGTKVEIDQLVEDRR